MIYNQITHAAFPGQIRGQHPENDKFLRYSINVSIYILQTRRLVAARYFEIRKAIEGTIKNIYRRNIIKDPVHFLYKFLNQL